MGNQQTIEKCGDWKDAKSFKQNHSKLADKTRADQTTNYRAASYDEKTASMSSTSRHCSQSNLSSLVAQSMLGSSTNNHMIRNIEKSYADYSSPINRRCRNVDVGSPELRPSNTMLSLPSAEKVELERNKVVIISPVNIIQKLKSSNEEKEIKMYLSPTSTSTTSTSDHEDDNSHLKYPDHPPQYDYSSLTDTIDYIKSELDNIKLQMEDSRKEQETLTQPPSTVLPSGDLEHLPESNTQSLQISNECESLAVNWTDLQKRIRHFLDETSHESSTNHLNYSYSHPLHLDTLVDDGTMLIDYMKAEKQSLINPITNKLDHHAELEIMKLDLDGDLLSVDLLNRTPRADTDIRNYSRLLYKAESDLTDEERIAVPIEELEFRTMDMEDDWTNVGQNQKYNQILEMIENEDNQICKTFSDSIQSTLLQSCAQNINHPPCDDCLLDEYTELHTSYTTELEYREKMEDRLPNRNGNSNCFSDDELDEILEASDDDDTLTDQKCTRIGSFLTEPSLDFSSSKSQVLRAKQPDVLTRDLVFERECNKKWAPHLFTVSEGCERCIFIANQSSIDEYNLLGHSKDITCTTGGCHKCPYFHCLEGKNEVRLCQHCFDFLHHNPFSLYRQSVKSKELPALKRKSQYASPIKK